MASLGGSNVLPIVVACLVALTLVEARTNFTQCAIDFKNNQTNGFLYAYRGPVDLDGSRNFSGGSAVISLPGCQKLCGTGSDWYDWTNMAATITTWLLPAIGLIVQAPYESNATRKTFLALVRWIGSPIASLSAILWNIKVSARCALMVDMSVAYDSYPDEDSTYAQIRDSFYILSVMNQYDIDPEMDAVAGERLLRIALFSDDIKLPGRDISLAGLRRQVAASLREGRRRGIVPVYISLLWFISSLGISILNAFAKLGQNAQAHDLALGLLLAWIPVLILTSIVDRNPLAADDMRRRLNALIDRVREALRDPHNQQTVMYQAAVWSEDDGWLHAIQDDTTFSQFFRCFAGQGRTRMHYGVAHPILSALESSYVGQHGRNWSRNAHEARRSLAYGYAHPKSLFSFDFRELWQILSAILIVDGVIAGPFILSYLTPTVGLGCRSGGYLIFMVNTGALLIFELLFWYMTSRHSPYRKHANWIFPVLETLSSLWLLFIVLAQTFGFYRRCGCMASTWDGKGGYIDFDSSIYNGANSVATYWGIGTAVPCTIMLAGFAFIISEWCEQSHLNTDNYTQALNGLQATRRWKRYTVWFRHLPDKAVATIKWAIRRKGRRSMMWTKNPAPTRKHSVYFSEWV